MQSTSNWEAPKGPISLDADCQFVESGRRVDGIAVLATTARIELATYSLGNCRSIQLSYVVSKREAFQVSKLKFKITV